MNEEVLIDKLREFGIKKLKEEETEEILMIWDTSELRKRNATKMENLMKVRDLNNQLVNGYRMFSGIGIANDCKVILFNEVFSTKEGDFRSQKEVILKGIEKTARSLSQLKDKRIIHIMDRGFDDREYFYHIWEQKQSLLVRVKQRKRDIYVLEEGEYEKEKIEDLLKNPQKREAIKFTYKKGRKRQTINGYVSINRIWFPRREVYSIEKRDIGSYQECYLLHFTTKHFKEDLILITDIKCETKEDAMKMLFYYIKRWSIEETFRFIKNSIEIEKVQVLSFTAVKNFIALGMIAAQYIFTKLDFREFPEVELIAKMGGWSGNLKRLPGKYTIQEGYERLIRLLIDSAYFEYLKQDWLEKHGSFSEKFQKILDGKFLEI